MDSIDEKKKDQRFINFYKKHPVIISGLIGGLLGYFVISPLAMIVAMFVENMMHTGSEVENIGSHLLDLLLLQSLSWSIIFIFLGAFIGVLFGYMQDKIIKLDKLLFETEKMVSIGQLAAGVGHEINTPISNILLISERLKMKIKDKDTVSLEDLDEISVQIENVTKIVSDLLDFSKSPEMEYIELNVNDLISISLSFIKNKMNENIEIIEKYDENIPMFLGEPNQLQLVFMNLINNANEAMPNGGRLEIYTSLTKEGNIRIIFKDSGLGISKENIDNIFDPFFTTKLPGEGSGLGLSICHGIIRRYKGRIEVESKVNIGTTFTLILPR